MNIIKSRQSLSLEQVRTSFRGYNFLEICIRPKLNGESTFVYLDIGGSITIIDHKYVNQSYPSTLISQIPSIEIRALGNKVHQSPLSNLPSSVH
jgi:hypothetical protein